MSARTSRFLVALGQDAARAPCRDRQRRQRRELAGESLGRGDADFRPGQGRHDNVALAGNRRCRHVDDREHVLLVLARITQRRQRVGGLARLRNEDRQRAGIERHLAVAELRGDIDLDRQAREPLEPVPRHHAGIVGRAAGGDRDALERAEIERQRHRQRHALGHHVEIMRQRVADHLRLLVNFLGHEMAVVALVDEHHRGLRLEHVAANDVALGVVDFGAGAMDDGAIAVFQIAHRVGERRERDRVRAEIHRIVAEADGERRALAGADQQILFAGEQERQRKGAAQPRQRRFDRLDRRAALRDLVADQVRDHFGVGFGRELDAL